MSNRTIVIGLTAAVLMQLLIVTGVLVSAAMPGWTGTEVKVKTIPVDPRSLFRGNYARLNYEFDTLPGQALATEGGIRRGEVVYVTLQQQQDGLYEYAGASLVKPIGGVFIRGRVVNHAPPYRINYGIEAFFAPKDKALKLERELINGGVAVLMVASSGKALLTDVVANNP